MDIITLPEDNAIEKKLAKQFKDLRVELKKLEKKTQEYMFVHFQKEIIGRLKKFREVEREALYKSGAKLFGCDMCHIAFSHAWATVAITVYPKNGKTIRDYLH